MTCYHDKNDHKYFKNLKEGAADKLAAFVDFDSKTLHGENKVIPEKYTELMALSVALTTQCVYCIEAHTKAAKKAGASEAEIAETAMITGALRAGGAVAHGLLAMKMYNEGEE